MVFFLCVIIINCVLSSTFLTYFPNISTFCTKSQFNDTRNFCEIFDEKEKDMKLNENEAKFIKNDLMVNALEYYLNIGICDSNLFNALKINQKKLNTNKLRAR